MYYECKPQDFPLASSIRRFFLRKIVYSAKILFGHSFWIDTVRTTFYHYGKIIQRRNVG